MSREKCTRAESMVNGGVQRLAVREKESTIADSNGKFENPALAGLMKTSVISQGGRQRWDSPDATELQAPFYNAAIQDSRMTLALFVETKFIPEHVQYKTMAGQTHYQAILKHVITPETVSRIFDPAKIASTRLRTVPHWPYLDEIRLCDLQSEHVRRIVSAADCAGYSAQTVKHIKNVCFAIIAHAQREGCFCGPNPASLVKLPRLLRNSSPGLTLEQAKAILDLLRYPFREGALFALTTGMSLPEICDLRWKDVNLDEFERFVDGHTVPACTVLVKTWWNRGGLGDSRASRKNRKIEIREPLLSTLRELRSRNPNQDAEDLVLISRTGDQIIPASFRVSELKRVGRALRIPWLTWGDLRRTHPVFLAESMSQRSSSMPFSAGNICANLQRAQALSREVAPCDNVLKSGSDSHRTFCFGRRLRANPELGSSLPNPSGI